MVLLLSSACHAILPLDPARDSTGGAPDAVAHDLASLETGQPLDASGDDAPGTGCAGITQPVIFCEDFEGSWPRTTVDISVWGTGTVMEPVSVPAAMVHAGKYSLLTKKDAGFGSAAAIHQLDAPITSGGLHFRTYINLTADPLPLTGQNFVVVLQLTAPAGDPEPDWNKTGFDLGPEGEVFLHCPSAGWINPGTKLVQKSWACVEIQVSMDSGAASLSIDGKQVQSCPAGRDRVPAGGYASATFGITSQHPAQVLYDDVVISRTPVGCP